MQTIILPSVAPEHKVLAGPFARQFPKARLYAVDKQYSFPLNLPKEFLGFPSEVTADRSRGIQKRPVVRTKVRVGLVRMSLPNF